MTKSKLKAKKSKDKKGGDGGGKKVAAASTNSVAAAGKENKKQSKSSAQAKQPTASKKKKKEKKETSVTSGGDAAKSSSKKQPSTAKAAAASSSKKKSSGGGDTAAKSSSSSKTSSKKKGTTTKASAATLALQKKWQDVADSMGGSKIVVNKAEAKKVVFNMLHDSFRPMNITAIHKELKGVVPSPVLKACLDDMTLDTSGGDDDDDDDPFAPPKKKKANKKSDGDDATGDATNNFVDSLRLKVGRNVNNSLYSVNHEKLANGGNGLPPTHRNELVAKEQKSSHEKDADAARLRDIMAQTFQLLLQPTNKEADATLAEGEKALADLKQRVEESRQHIGNEKIRFKTKKRIRTIADVWWKRRRLCKDFLDNMEDMTEGAISAKKCLAGDGQMDIESDETILKEALEAYTSRKGKAKKQSTADGDLQATETLIGVQMDGQGRITRVHANAE